MRLSEAIRLGAMMNPQAYGVSDERQDVSIQGDVLGLRTVTRTCAIRAALEAFPCPLKPTDQTLGVITARDGQPAPAGKVLDLPDDWLVIVSAMAPCPSCGVRDKGLRVIAHLNDMHRWSREAIADWVETLEAIDDRRLHAPDTLTTVD